MLLFSFISAKIMSMDAHTITFHENRINKRYEKLLADFKNRFDLIFSK